MYKQSCAYTYIHVHTEIHTGKCSLSVKENTVLGKSSHTLTHRYILRMYVLVQINKNERNVISYRQKRYWKTDEEIRSFLVASLRFSLQHRLLKGKKALRCRLKCARRQMVVHRRIRLRLTVACHWMNELSRVSPIPRDDGQLEFYQLNLVDYSRMPDRDGSLAIEDARTGLSSMEWSYSCWLDVDYSYSLGYFVAAVVAGIESIDRSRRTFCRERRIGISSSDALLALV